MLFIGDFTKQNGPYVICSLKYISRESDNCCILNKLLRFIKNMSRNRHFDILKNGAALSNRSEVLLTDSQFV